MVVCSPRKKGLGKVSPWICRCPPQQLSVSVSVSVTLSWNSGGLGSWQEPFHTCVLVDFRARLADLVAAVMTAIVCQKALWFDPQVPVVQVGEEFSA